MVIWNQANKLKYIAFIRIMKPKQDIYLTFNFSDLEHTSQYTVTV